MAVVCFMVLAHRGPQQFGRLVEALSADPRVRICAHIDARVDARPFVAEASDGVRFVEQRVAVRWGGWSQVEAVLRLCEESVQRFPEATHFWLVSGDTYPLRAAGALVDFIEAGPETQYLNLVKMPSGAMGKPLSRVSHHYIEHDPRTNRLSKVLRLWNRMARRPFRRRLEGLELFGGSTWFSLTRAAVEYVLRQSQSYPRFTRLAKTALCPDEFYLHTLIANSPFLEVVRPNTMYADWTPGQGAVPQTLTPHHLSALKGGIETDGYGRHILLTARKVGGAGGAELTELIRNDVWPLAVPEVGDVARAKDEDR